MAIQLLLTAFSFQTMVPSLTRYLKRNANSLRWAIIGGTHIAFTVYGIWQMLILGIVPVDGPMDLQLCSLAASRQPNMCKAHEYQASQNILHFLQLSPLLSE